jgi:hypothetical protein
MIVSGLCPDGLETSNHSICVSLREGACSDHPVSSIPDRRKTMPEISEVLASFTESQALLALAAFLLAFLGYALVKRLLKLALFTAVFLGIYVGLVYFTA